MDLTTPHPIHEYDEFVAIVERLGFMPLSANAIGFPNLSALTAPEMWHTTLDTDPWRWKSRIVDDGKAAYAKLFGGKPGFISLAWYPAFIALRRQGRSIEQLYQDGQLSHEARQIHRLFSPGSSLAMHQIRARLGLGKDARNAYERALIELQMRAFLTTSGMARLLSADGEPHSWPATEFSRVEDWAPHELVARGLDYDPVDAEHDAEQRAIAVLAANDTPADLKKVRRFIGAPR